MANAAKLFAIFCVIVVSLSDVVVHGHPTAFDLRASLDDASKTNLQAWIKAGARTRIDVFPKFDEELGLPEDSQACVNDVSKYLPT